MPVTSDTSSSLQQALSHHQAGRLAEAEAGYRAILSAQPEQPDALHFLGVIAMQVGRLDAAIKLIERSVTIAPNFASHSNLGEAYRNANRLNDAIEHFLASLKLNPNHVDAMSNLSLALIASNRIDEASAMIDRAIAIDPRRANLHDTLGLIRARELDWPRAMAAHRRAIELEPRLAGAHSNLALVFARQEKFDEAIASAQHAVSLAPGASQLMDVLAQVLEQAGEPERALAVLEEANAKNPAYADHYGRRAELLGKLGRNEEEQKVLEAGIVACPKDPRMHNAMSITKRSMRDYTSAVRSAETAVALSPNFSGAHGSLSLALLSIGDFARGFAEYEWRWRCDNFTTRSRDFGCPMWNGSDPAGRTILIHTEQGFGDVIQFARYIPLLAARGAKVIVECHHSLRTLMQTVRGVSHVIASGLAAPAVDLHLPIMSLPLHFGTKTPEDIPHAVPYLYPEESRFKKWREKTASDRLRAGLIWMGNKVPDEKRTIPGDALAAAFTKISGVQFFSLQKWNATDDDARRSHERVMNELSPIDLASQLSDFHETAAAMQSVDVIVSIDSAPAHLAGALGRETLTLLPWSCDWRWLPESEKSMWYPTMKLFRQRRAMDWSSPLDEVCAYFQSRVSGSSR